MQPAARLSDLHTCAHAGGPIVPACEPTVLIGGKPAARKGDHGTCKAPLDTIAKGEPTVLIGGQQAARLGDPTEHGGVIIEGEPTVLIGSECPDCLRRAAKERAAFIKSPPQGL